jgi:hypothetical protein
MAVAERVTVTVTFFFFEVALFIVLERVGIGLFIHYLAYDGILGCGFEREALYCKNQWL